MGLYRIDLGARNETEVTALSGLSLIPNPTTGRDPGPVPSTSHPHNLRPFLILGLFPVFRATGFQDVSAPKFCMYFLLPSSNLRVQSTFSLLDFTAPTVIGETNEVPGPSLSDTNIFLVHANTCNLNSSLRISTSQSAAMNEH
jgi:hypothetical protein